MFSRFYTHAISLSLIIALAVPSAFLFYPQKAQADSANCAAVVAAAIASIIGISTAAKVTGVPTSDPGTQSGAASIAGSSYGQFFKDCILIPLAIQLGKAMLRNITNSIVNWVNSGFEGKPTFVTDFKGLVTDTTDQVIGNFIDRDLGAGFLCNSFSLQIRIALAQSYLPYDQRARCTLSQIQQNIEGFVQNDNAGGWNNWLSVTTVPQNNIYGATILAQNELSQRILEKLKIQNDMLSRNKGFFDLQVCDQYETQTQANARVLGAGPATGGASGSGFQNFDTGMVTFGNTTTALPKSQALPTFGSGASGSVVQSSTPQCTHYTTKTPGGVVESQLNKALQTDISQLEVANDIDAIIGALANQLMSKVITGAQGLLGAGKSSNGSYSPTTYQGALNPAVDPALSTAINQGIDQRTQDANLTTLFADVSSLGTTTSTAADGATSTTPVDATALTATEAANALGLSASNSQGTVTDSTPLSYTVGVSGTRGINGLLVTTTLKRNGVAIPFLSIFSSVQTTYGVGNGTKATRYVSSPTDGSAAWSNVAVGPNSSFSLKLVATKDQGVQSFVTDSYALETVVTDANGRKLKTESTSFTIQ